MSRPLWYQSDFLPSDGDLLTLWSKGLAPNRGLASVQRLCNVYMQRQGQTGPSSGRDCSADVLHIPALTGPPSKSRLQTDGYSQLELKTDSCRLGALLMHMALYRRIQSIRCVWTPTHTSKLNPAKLCILTSVSLLSWSRR